MHMANSSTSIPISANWFGEPWTCRSRSFSLLLTSWSDKNRFSSVILWMRLLCHFNSFLNDPQAAPRNGTDSSSKQASALTSEALMAHSQVNILEKCLLRKHGLQEIICTQHHFVSHVDINMAGCRKGGPSAIDWSRVYGGFRIWKSFERDALCWPEGEFYSNYTRTINHRIHNADEQVSNATNGGMSAAAQVHITR